MPRPSPRPTLFPYTTLFRSMAKSTDPPRSSERDTKKSWRNSDLHSKQDRDPPRSRRPRSEEHTSELQSRGHLVCRLLLEKKKKKKDKPLTGLTDGYQRHNRE